MFRNKSHQALTLAAADPEVGDGGAEESLYRILGLPDTATLSDIRAAFKKRALLFHPDKNKSKDANEEFRKLNEAYRILSDASQKAAYDRTRKAKPLNEMTLLEVIAQCEKELKTYLSDKMPRELIPILALRFKRLIQLDNEMFDKLLNGNELSDEDLSKFRKLLLKYRQRLAEVTSIQTTLLLIQLNLLINSLQLEQKGITFNIAIESENPAYLAISVEGGSLAICNTTITTINNLLTNHLNTNDFLLCQLMFEPQYDEIENRYKDILYVNILPSYFEKEPLFSSCLTSQQPLALTYASTNQPSSETKQSEQHKSQEDTLIENLLSYANTRNKQEKYTGSWFGYSREQKVNAATYLANSLAEFALVQKPQYRQLWFKSQELKQHIGALTQGNSKLKNVAKDALDYLDNKGVTIPPPGCWRR